jgi:hypothetical protein
VARALVEGFHAFAMSLWRLSGSRGHHAVVFILVRNLNTASSRDAPTARKELLMKRLLPAGLAALALLSAVTGCGEKAKAPLHSGISVANMDTTVRPQDDFYAYANGGWLAATEIPADLPTIGSFVELFLESERNRHGILEELTTQTDLSATERKLGDLYSSFMDSTAVEAAGIEPLCAELARIDAFSNRGELAAHFGRNLRLGIQNPLGVYVDGDFDDS